MKRIVALAVPIALAFACAPDGLSSTCRFTGDTTNPCGQCIAQNCRKQVDSCCEDSVCRDFLSGLDRCANGGSCTSITSSVSSSLDSCVTTSCSSVCGGASSSTDAGSSKPTNDASAYTYDCFDDGADGCTCTPNGPGTKACTSTSVTANGNGYCCRDTSWPGKNTYCECHPFTCKQVTTGNGLVTVRCTSSDQGGSQFTGSDSYCCVDTTLKQCECGPQALCDVGEGRVNECSVDSMECGGDRQKVTSCSD